MAKAFTTETLIETRKGLNNAMKVLLDYNGMRLAVKDLEEENRQLKAALDKASADVDKLRSR